MTAKPHGKIIVLNGTSSSGKSSIISAFQELIEEPYLEFGFDRIFHALPARHLREDSLYHQIFSYEDSEVDGQTFRVCRAREVGFRMISGLHRSIVALAETGNNVLVDHIWHEPSWVTDCASLFHTHWSLLVGVRCPLEIVKEREQRRTDRSPGIGSGHYHMIHKHGIYDIEVDTSLLSSIECAKIIKDFIDSGSQPTAFRSLAHE